MPRKGGGNTNNGAAPAAPSQNAAPVADDQANLPVGNETVPGTGTDQQDPMAGSVSASDQNPPMGEQPPASSPIIDWMKSRGFILDEGYTEDILHQNLLEADRAFNEVDALRARIAELETQKPQTLASASAPAAGASANAPANTPTRITAPQIRREWLSAVDRESGAHPDPTINQKLTEYRDFIQDNLPAAIERIMNLEADLQARIDAAVQKAQSFTEQKLTTTQVEQQFNNFLFENFAHRGPQGPVIIRVPGGGTEYQLTQEGMRVQSIVDDLIENGMSEHQAKQFAMKHHAPAPAAPARYGAPPKAAAPIQNRTQAPQQEPPTRRTHQPPTNAASKNANRLRTDMSFEEMYRHNAAMMGTN